MVTTPKRQWFLMGDDTVLPDTTITLGKLITSPREPDGPPKLRAVEIADEPIYEFECAWSQHETTSRGGSVGVFASWTAGVVGVGADVAGAVQRSSSRDVSADSLLVRTFEPGKAYLTKLLNDPNNRAELDGQRKRRAVFQKLFVITGIQVARGGTVTTEQSTTWEGDVKVSVNPTMPAGAPIPGAEVGPAAGLNKTVVTGQTSGKHDFVYAFKINKIMYKREKGRVNQERYTRGAALGESSRYSGVSEEAGRKADEKEDEQLGFVVIGMQKQDAGTNEFGVEGKEVGDGESDSCIVIDPSTIKVDGDEEDKVEGD